MATRRARRYRILDKVRYDGVDQLGERFTYTAKAGAVVTPKSEHEEQALEALRQQTEAVVIDRPARPFPAPDPEA